MKRAVLIGVDKYREPNINDLHGCVNDVRDMEQLVTGLWAYDEVHILTDENATRDRILGVTERVIRDSDGGDKVLWYDSSHGSQRKDDDGDEADGRDEVLCPHDYPNFIRDDDLAALFAQLPATADLEVIIDACHSGTAIKGPRARNKSIPPDKNVLTDTGPVRRRIRTAVEARTNHVLWAGCRDDQTSAEIIAWDTDHGTHWRGAFTMAFCREVRYNSMASRYDNLRGIRARLSTLSQVPQLSVVGVE